VLACGAGPPLATSCPGESECEGLAVATRPLRDDVGDQTPVACGDYLAGTNHVLPTSGAARFSSGLRTDDFMRTFSVVENTRERMLSDANILATLAEFEGLPQHARTARMRAARTE